MFGRTNLDFDSKDQLTLLSHVIIYNIYIYYIYRKQLFSVSED